MTQEHNKKSSYSIIPSYVMDNKNLEVGAKLLYARISMYSQDGRCWASNAHLAEKENVCVRTIQRWLKQLSDEGYIDIEIEKIGLQTKRNIWIIIDFKKQFTKRHPCHDGVTPMSCRDDTHVTHINIKDTNIKKTTTQWASPVAVFIDKKIYICLEPLDIPLKEKEWITRKYQESNVVHAVQWVTCPGRKVTSFIAALKWACNVQPQIEKNPADIEEENKRYAKLKHATAKKNSMTIMEVLTKGVEFIITNGSGGISKWLDYAEKGFKDQLDTLMRKYSLC